MASIYGHVAFGGLDSRAAVTAAALNLPQVADMDAGFFVLIELGD